MKIELVDRNAKLLKDAYGLSEDEMLELEKKLSNIDFTDLTNNREHVIPFLAQIDFDTICCASDIIGALEEIEIDSTVDLIEAICNVDEKLGKKYLSIILRILDYKYKPFIDAIEFDDYECDCDCDCNHKG